MCNQAVGTGVIEWWSGGEMVEPREKLKSRNREIGKLDRGLAELVLPEIGKAEFHEALTSVLGVDAQRGKCSSNSGEGKGRPSDSENRQRSACAQATKSCVPP